MTQNQNQTKTEMAERLIKNSRRNELHSCETPESECLGCDLMRAGLEILAEAGDKTVYRA